MPDPDEPTVILGDRFVAALALAVELHAHQARKANGVPYVSHLLAAAGLVLEHGGDEDTAIAALLHDGPEDQGGEATLARIRAELGDRVADIVAACSDTFESPKPPWRARKEAFVARLPRAGSDVWLVALADKVHNARTLVADLRADGPATLDRFTGGRDGTLWYYRTLADRLTELAPGPLATELAELATEMERRAGR
ncbi:MAG TPA: HD domain-containing protein [Acidimicrobiia bacterium]|nr:HD domain-containing protein [Acidimicrobiia bacterium]